MLNSVERHRLHRWIATVWMAVLLLTGWVCLQTPSATAASFSSAFANKSSMIAAAGAEQQSVVTLSNRFTVAKTQVPDFLERWEAIGKYMDQQSGFVSAELRRDVLNPQEWIMSEQWKSLGDYRKAISTEQFQTLIQDFPGKATWFAADLFPSR
jgi:quinol monooxygenase YgiN